MSESNPAGHTVAPEPPESARTLFGDAVGAVTQFADLLAGPGVERGVIGPREVSRVWDRHLSNCGSLVELVPSGASVVDVGSGAGLPGIVMALTRPDLSVTLLEPLLRRTRFLEESLDRLGLGERVVVLRGRAEEVSRRVSASVVTARAVAPLDRLAGWCLPLVESGGHLLAIKGGSAAEEMAAATPTIRRLGGSVPEIVQTGVGVLDPPTTVVRVRVDGPPRRHRKR
jgi:16S rRNA (guanine527-N7)-methyltransferase